MLEQTVNSNKSLECTICYIGDKFVNILYSIISDYRSVISNPPIVDSNKFGIGNHMSFRSLVCHLYRYRLQMASNGPKLTVPDITRLKI